MDNKIQNNNNSNYKELREKHKNNEHILFIIDHINYIIALQELDFDFKNINLALTYKLSKTKNKNKITVNNHSIGSILRYIKKTNQIEIDEVKRIKNDIKNLKTNIYEYNHI